MQKQAANHDTYVKTMKQQICLTYAATYKKLQYTSNP